MSAPCTGLSVVTLALVAATGCRDPAPDGAPQAAPSSASLAPASAAPGPSAGPARRSRLEVHWDPATGRGDVVHHYASGDRLRTCFHCDYQGYTGGLVIGAQGGSGMGFYPARPIRGHRQINVLCAQDESLWDRDERREYTYGWSENFGTGADGERLAYVRGKVLEQTPERVTLAARNEGGCYVVDKVAATSPEVRHWILATRVTNRCARAIHFDLFSGDDPWLGLYRTAAGDVGWTPAGLVQHERAFAAGELTAAGLYDLGNAAADEREGSFTGQANFFALDPALPLPDFAAFANRFAHGPPEVDPRRPLDDETMTALNLGWRGVTLGPGEGMTFAFAVGLAQVDDGTGELPRLPALPLADWSRWRQLLDAERGARRVGLDFAAERVELELNPNALTVRARYLVENHGAAPVTGSIRYPIAVDAGQARPTTVTVDGRPLPTVEGNTGAEVRFPLTVPARGLAAFAVEYTQALTAPRATYVVTSARTWSYPIARAELVVRHPTALGPVKLSYPASFTRRSAETVEHTVLCQPFVPARELVASW